MRRSIGFVIALVLGAVLAGCGGNNAKTEGEKTGETGKKFKIAVIPKGTTHDFWKSVHAGAMKAAKELGDVEIYWTGPDKEDQRQQQIDLVQNVLSAGSAAIVLAPLDDKALVSPVKQAAEKKVPVIIIDSGLQGEAGKDYASFVATDNEKGGTIAGENMVKLLAGKPNPTVLILRYAEGSASTVLREKGFVDTIGKAKNIKLIDPHQYAGATQEEALKVSDNLLAANQKIDGVFCPNESSTAGMLTAIKNKGLAGKVVFIGFDASEKLVNALKAGEIQGLVLQNPVNMGYQGVMTAHKVLKGEKVDLRIDTGVAFVTKANMDEPDKHALIEPDLSILKSE